MNFLDDDRSGTISREELAAGFKTMGVIIPQAHLKNLFVILDKDGDNEIGMDEFEAVFGKYLAHGKKVHQISEAQMNLDFKEIEDAEQLGNRQTKAEALDGGVDKAPSDEQMLSIEDDRVTNIQNAAQDGFQPHQLEEGRANGELKITIKSGTTDFVHINDKEQFVFVFEMPRYNNKGRLCKSTIADKSKM